MMKHLIKRSIALILAILCLCVMCVSCIEEDVFLDDDSSLNDKLGGKDKNLDFTELASVVCRRVKAVFISHDTEEKKVYTAITKDENFDGDTLTVKLCDGFDDAFANASGFAKEGEVVLLSPAMTSFDEFLNFEMRGKHFKELVASLGED